MLCYPESWTGLQRKLRVMCKPVSQNLRAEDRRTRVEDILPMEHGLRPTWVNLRSCHKQTLPSITKTKENVVKEAGRS